MPKELDDFPQFKDLITKKNKFILDENNNAIPANLMEWGEFLENSPIERRRVARDVINGKLISTVFLGLDHSFNGSLHIFETMIFESEENNNDIYCDRYSTWKEAEEGHKKAIQWVLEEYKENE